MALTWMIGHRMLDVDDVGLPNLLAGRRIVPELLQDQASPERLGAAVLRILEDAKLRSRLHEEFDSLRGALQNNADARAAEAVLEVAAA